MYDITQGDTRAAADETQLSDFSASEIVWYKRQAQSSVSQDMPL
jgi:hypothetical protein